MWGGELRDSSIVTAQTQQQDVFLARAISFVADENIPVQIMMDGNDFQATILSPMPTRHSLNMARYVERIKIPDKNIDHLGADCEPKILKRIEGKWDEAENYEACVWQSM